MSETRDGGVAARRIAVLKASAIESIRRGEFQNGLRALHRAVEIWQFASYLKLEVPELSSFDAIEFLGLEVPALLTGYYRHRSDALMLSYPELLESGEL